LGKGWEDPGRQFRAFFSGFGDEGVAARREADQSGTFVVRVGDQFHQPFLLQSVDQNLNILAGAESGASDLRHGLRTETLEELKSGSAGAWERGTRVGLEAIR
jgi:hypothetical protein